MSTPTGKTTLLVRGLDEEGPGDVVGAFCGEADVPADAIGDIDEPRRFNVALTRARRKAVVVGDSSTVRAADVYDDFVEYARVRGRVVRP